MNKWLRRQQRKGEEEVYFNMLEILRDKYKAKLLPLEECFCFHDFHSPPLEDSSFEAKPMILLMGQYSTGKTTFIKYMLEKDFPGMRIGPEPTTDKFVVIMNGETEGNIPGNAVVVDPSKQFRGLSSFGNTFLNRFQISVVNSGVLQSLTIIDTPGILAGEKQRLDRGYDFAGVLRWFAERVDAILLLFDAHKLDISDELRRCIESISDFDDKVRIILNKADMLNTQQLLRVYGALMWSLGKVLRCPEVSRVYIGSFWDQPLQHDFNRKLFQDEEHDLFQDIQGLPKNAALRKLNDLIRRARLARVHALIVREIRKEMPQLMGKESKKREIIDNLDRVYSTVQKEHHLTAGDFPDMKKMQDALLGFDFNKFRQGKMKLIDNVEQLLGEDIARLMSQVPQDHLLSGEAGGMVLGGAIGNNTLDSPFSQGKNEGINAGAGELEWIVSKYKERYDMMFQTLQPVGGKVSGAAAKMELLKSKLPNSVLRRIWMASDIDRDGQLDSDEFALAMYLVDLKVSGFEIPAYLPDHLIPPSKRNYKRSSVLSMQSVHHR